MTMVTVFRSRLRAGVEEDYSRVADEMSRLVTMVEGFIDQKFYMSPDAERVTIVRFRDQESHQVWAEHPAHLAAQRRGRDEFYSWYDISVSEEVHSRHFGDSGL
jgi:heme-degrading monooxygenase HmoA